ncbi:asparagine synthase-related protein [Rhodanobacter umsongensis]|uniref:asparagine synthase (glutamine-hydrolyzing) n=1 Tax=Rhodanobacter umsongensis TaxID=633153 RepID=A0ABW0JN98_9GAMM
MCYRYIALYGDLQSIASESASPLKGELQNLTLEYRGRVGRMTLLAPRDVPVLYLPDGGLLLGDLYRGDGRPVRDLTDIPDQPTPSAFRQHFLDHYWGEYLLFQPADRGDSATVMRDPSGGIACAHSLKNGSGFITSDLAVASRLGLYREEVDWAFVRHCLRYPNMKIARTGLAGVCELLPGCILSIDGEKTSTHIGWSPWRFVMAEERQRDPIAATRSIREATTSVVRAMAETDRTVLLELSGGLDSSIVAACLKDAPARVTCCTAITPLPGADERRYASQMAAQLGIDLQQQILDFSDAQIAFELPLHSLRPAAWALSRAVARAMDEAAEQQNVNGLFSGGGGDTVFGYLRSAAPAADAFKAGGLAEGFSAIADLSRLHNCTVVKAARLTLRKLYFRPKAPCTPDHTFLSRMDTAALFEPHPWFSAPPGVSPGDCERIFELAGTQLFADGTLRAGGRRVRFPLLSQPVMEACLRVPSWLWISSGRNRAMARAAFSGELPQDVLNRRSKGTFMNYTFEVYRRNKETIRSFLLDGHLRSHGLLEPEMLDRFLERSLPARDRSFMRIFDLCMIENWTRNHAP